MKLFVACALFGLLGTVAAHVDSPVLPVDSPVLPADSPVFPDYHRDVGIPMAARIKAAEDAMDFDGARIVGGSPAQLGQYPYLGGVVVTLSDGQLSVCGSSLVSSTRSLTAAGCWRTLFSQARDFTVVLGSTALFTGGTRIVTSDVETHSGFNGITPIDNIAIIRFPAVTFNEYIQPIAIASGIDNFVGKTAWAAGYGLTSEDGAITTGQVQHHVSVVVVNNIFCQLAYGAQIGWTSIMCAATTGGRGTCFGDSGGPLVTDNLLIGITSFGHRDSCEQEQPVGFTRVASYTDWIQQRL